MHVSSSPQKLLSQWSTPASKAYISNNKTIFFIALIENEVAPVAYEYFNHGPNPPSHASLGPTDASVAERRPMGPTLHSRKRVQSYRIQRESRFGLRMIASINISYHVEARPKAPAFVSPMRSGLDAMCAVPMTALNLT